MRQKDLILLFVMGIVFDSCLKSHYELHDSTEQSFIVRARTFFDSTVLNSKIPAANYKCSIGRVVKWDNMEVHKYASGYALTAPLIYQYPLYIKEDRENLIFHLEDLTQLLIYCGNDHALHLEIITKYPDSNYLSNPDKLFTGLASVDDWWGNNLGKYLLDGSQIKKYVPPAIQSASMIRTCTVIYGYNYSPGDPGGGYSWVEESDCHYTYIQESPDGATGGSLGGGVRGGGGGSSSSISIAMSPPDNPIANIADYFKCFTSGGGSDHNYSVTLCVQQPIPGDRAAYKWVDGGPIGSGEEGNIVNVGHTFLIFSEYYGGTTITRNVGFYPSSGVKPGNSASQGQLNDDETHSYNISVTFSVTSLEFFNMLNFVSLGNNPGFYYNLNSENCTTFAIQTLAKGDIVLPLTIGTWPGGMGCNPGDLGEDIRQMSHVIKSTVQNFHPNKGTCL